MSLTLCCQYLKLITTSHGNSKYINIMEERSLQLGSFNKNKYSNEHILQVYRNNTSNLLKVIKIIHQEGFTSLRVSSSLFPLFDIVDPNLLEDNIVLSTLKQIGEFALSNNIRLSCHPGQFVILSSKNPQVIVKSVKELEYHAWMFDKMNLPLSPFYAINVHGGVKDQSATLINTINNLPSNVRSRLTLENDESSYNISDLLEVNKHTNIPIVFDSHHYTFNTGNLSLEDAMELSIQTWNGIKPITHLSNTTLGLENGSFTERRKHSDYIHYIPDCQLTAYNSNRIDIDVEAKMKNLAIMKMVKDFNIKL